ncbi:MAG TPA: amidohydrolase family protein [Polyangiaceae bacterium]
MIALVGGTVVALDPPRVEALDVVVDGGKITQVGGPVPAGATRIDAHRCVVTPAFTVGHTHLYSSLACGMPPPDVSPASFPEILARVWWKLDRALDDELVSCSALVGAIEAARRGVACVIDHHSSPRAIHGSLDRIAESLHRVGIRAALCYETSDRDGKSTRDAGLAENARFACGPAGDRTSYLRAMTGAHAPFTLEDETLEALADLSTRRSAPLHVHVAEDPTDLADAARRRTSLGARLQRMGAYRPGALIAHAVHLDARDREELARAGAWIATNARSNMNNAVGLSPATGSHVVLGTDGIGADMLAEAHAHFLRHAEAKDGLAGEALPRLVAAQRLSALLFDGVDRARRVAPGERADLAILEYDPATPMTAENLAGHVLFGWSSACVRDTMVAGKFVLRQREVQGVDAHAVAACARDAATRLWSRMRDIA